MNHISLNAEPITTLPFELKIGLVQASYKEIIVDAINVTKKESDKHFFKVPSLKEISKTSPYLDNDFTKILKKTVCFMTKHQIGHSYA